MIDEIQDFREGDRVIVSLSRSARTSRGHVVVDGETCWVLRVVGKMAVLKIDPGCPDIRGTFKVPLADVKLL